MAVLLPSEVSKQLPLHCICLPRPVAPQQISYPVSPVVASSDPVACACLQCTNFDCIEPNTAPIAPVSIDQGNIINSVNEISARGIMC